MSLPLRAAVADGRVRVVAHEDRAVALMVLEASRRVPVILGGGTQMAAEAALSLRLLEEGQPGNPKNLGLATTRWVQEGPTADLAGILERLPRPVPGRASALDFGGSAVASLRGYEDGLVKEGVGAGAAALAAFLGPGLSASELTRRIEDLTRDLGPL